LLKILLFIFTINLFAVKIDRNNLDLILSELGVYKISNNYYFDSNNVKILNFKENCKRYRILKHERLGRLSYFLNKLNLTIKNVS
jgi:hypothetical protein